jgi:dihydroxy-acid dehydratase
MPEAGLLPIPRKLAREGVTDMLRISDGRMSGTAGGTIVLHVSPEAVLPGSVFGVVRDGDVVWVDVEGRGIGVDIEEEEVQRRLEERRREFRNGGGGVWVERESKRGYRGLYERCVNQAEEGCDFDFLRAGGPDDGRRR